MTNHKSTTSLKPAASNERAILAWDKAVRGEHGGAREGAGRKPATAAEVLDHDPETGEIKSDNITLDQTERQGGTSQQQGLRRLEKAATAGDGNAADLLRRVVDPNDAMTINGGLARSLSAFVASAGKGLVAISNATANARFGYGIVFRKFVHLHGRIRRWPTCFCCVQFPHQFADADTSPEVYLPDPALHVLVVALPGVGGQRGGCCGCRGCAATPS